MHSQKIHPNHKHSLNPDWDLMAASSRSWHKLSHALAKATPTPRDPQSALARWELRTWVLDRTVIQAGKLYE